MPDFSDVRAVPAALNLEPQKLALGDTGELVTKDHAKVDAITVKIDDVRGMLGELRAAGLDSDANVQSVLNRHSVTVITNATPAPSGVETPSTDWAEARVAEAGVTNGWAYYQSPRAIVYIAPVRDGEIFESEWQPEHRALYFDTAPTPAQADREGFLYEVIAGGAITGYRVNAGAVHQQIYTAISNATHNALGARVTTAENKLGTIENGATGDQTGAEMVSAIDGTGTHQVPTVEQIGQFAAGGAGTAFKGIFPNTTHAAALSDLQAEYPSPEPGWFAVTDDGSTRETRAEDGGAWVLVQTPAGATTLSSNPRLNDPLIGLDTTGANTLSVRVDGVVSDVATATTERTRLISTQKWRVSAASLGIVNAGDDAAAALVAADTALRSLVTQHGAVDVVFDGGAFDWGEQWAQPNGVNLCALRETTLAVSTGSAIGRMILMESAARASVTGDFVLDMATLVSTVAIEAPDTAVPTWGGLSFLDTGADATTAGPGCVRVGHGSGAVIDDIESDGCGRMIQLRGDGNTALGATDVLITNPRQRNPRQSAELLQINKYAQRVTVRGFDVGAFPATTLGGHAIQTAGHADGEGPTIGDLVIERGRIVGRPGIAWSGAAANGAHGDFIALRGVRKADVTRCHFEHGGEYGIDVLQGCEDVTIEANHFESIDGSAVIVGSSGTADTVQRTHVRGNTLIDSGLNQAGDLGSLPASCIHAKNDNRTRIEGNTIQGGTAFGIYVSKNPAPTSIFIDDNTISGTAAQAAGLPAIYTGQMTAPGLASDIPTASRDTAHLASSANIPTATGVINGVALPAGRGDIDMPIADIAALSPWRAIQRGALSIKRDGTMNLAWSAGEYVGIYRGESIRVAVPAQATLSFYHILSTYDGTGVSATTNVDPTVIENPASLGTTIAPPNTAVAFRVWLHVPSGRFYLHRGQGSYTSVGATALYQHRSEGHVRAALMSDCLFLGSLIVRSTETNLNNAAQAKWEPIDQP